MSINDDVVLVETDLVCSPDVFSRIIHSPHANAALLDRWRLGMDGTVVTIEGVPAVYSIFHHNAHGNHIVAEAIVAELARRGFSLDRP